MTRTYTPEQKAKNAARSKRARQLKAGTHAEIDTPMEARPDGFYVDGVKVPGRYATPFMPFVSTENPFKHTALVEIPPEFRVMSEKKPRRMKMNTQVASNSQPSMDAIMSADQHKPEVAAVTAPRTVLEECVVITWNVDRVAHASSENSAVALGKALLDLKAIKHGDMAAWIKTNLGVADAVTNRCDYAVRKAKAAGYKSAVESETPKVDPVAEQKRIAAERKADAEAAAKAAEELRTKVNAMPNGVNKDDPAVIEKVALDKAARKAEVVANQKLNSAKRAMDAIPLVVARADVKAAAEKVVEEVKTRKDKLAAQVDAIAETLRSLVKPAISGNVKVKGGQLLLNFDADVIATDVKAKVNTFIANAKKAFEWSETLPVKEVERAG